MLSLPLHLSLLSGLAFASPYADLSGDIAASAMIPAAPEAVFSYLLDLNHIQALMPCAGKWEMSQRTFGEGASAMVRYDVAAMHRKLPVSLSRADAPYRIDLEHLGNLGFTTVISLKSVPTDTGLPQTEVRLLTPLNAPPWPLRKYYHETVQVEWNQCYATTLQNLATTMGTPAPTPMRALSPEVTPYGESFEPLTAPIVEAFEPASFLSSD